MVFGDAYCTYVRELPGPLALGANRPTQATSRIKDPDCARAIISDKKGPRGIRRHCGEPSEFNLRFPHGSPEHKRGIQLYAWILGEIIACTACYNEHHAEREDD